MPCSCEGCSALRELPAPLASALPLRSLNLLHTGVLRLPVPAGARLLRQSKGVGEDEGSSSDAEGGAPSGGSGGGSYLQHLTELRWGVAEWERRRAPGGSSGSSALLDGEGLPDLTPLLRARRLRVVQLAHVPASGEAQLAALRQRLPLLHRLQVNSAVLVG